MRKTRKLLAIALSLSMLFQQAGFAQVTAQLNAPVFTYQVPDRFRPMHLRYFSYEPTLDNVRLIVDKGDSRVAKGAEAQDETRKLVEYFRIGLALPNETFWVNLRPDSPNSIIDDTLTRTDLGRVLLEADLQLKKDTAAFTSPDTREGRIYWNKLYEKAQEIYGFNDATIPTLVRPWIVPGEIIIGTNQNGAYIYKATLKVCLEQDYIKDSPFYNFDDPRLKELNDYSSQLIRATILPKLTKEINASKKYSALRQVYYSLILAQWYKNRSQATGQKSQENTLLRSIDSNDLTGLTSKTAWSKTEYFNAYRTSFQQGEYNRQEQVPTARGIAIRQYFSGGAKLDINPAAITTYALGTFLPDGGAYLGMNWSLEGNSIADAPRDGGVDIGQIAKEFGLSDIEASYLRQLYKKFVRSQKQTLGTSSLVIGDDFTPSALMLEKDRKDLLGAVEYAEINNQQNTEAAKAVTLVLNPLNGGIGKGVGREAYLEDLYGPDRSLGAKASDLYFTVKHNGNEELVSVSEAKLLRSINEAKSGKYARIQIQQLASTETIESINKLFDSPNFEDRIDTTRTQKRTYREFVKELQKQGTHVELVDSNTEHTFPIIDKETDKFRARLEGSAPGGHGVSGYWAVLRMLEPGFSASGSTIAALYNEDGMNNMPDEAMVGWMARNKVPMVMVTTTKTGLDMKGGQIGVQKVGPKYKKAILEIAQADNNGQEDLFKKVGLTEGERGAQYFNTNMALLNLSVLKPFLTDLIGIIGRDAFEEAIAPDLIKEGTKDGKSYSLGGAMGSVLLNLAGYIEATNDTRIIDLAKTHGLYQNGKISLLRIVNVDEVNRTKFFTPLKTAFDYDIQYHSDFYQVDPQAWQLKQVGSQIPAVDLKDSWYKEVVNTQDAFKGVSLKGLTDLTVRGKVKLQNAILKGSVTIDIRGNDVVDLNAPEMVARYNLKKQDGRLVLENAVISDVEEVRLSAQDRSYEIEFGTSGWRDQLSANFTTLNVRRAAQGMAAFYLDQLKNHSLKDYKLKEGDSIIIGYDPRKNNIQFAREIAAVFAANDVPVKIILDEPTPTPVLAFLAHVDETVAGTVNLTASHNPAVTEEGKDGDDGIKFSAYHGGASDKEVTDSISAFANEATSYTTMSYDEAVSKGLIAEVTPQDAVRKYVDGYIVPTLKEIGAWDSIVNYIKTNPDFKLVLDPMQGTAVEYLRSIFGQIAQAAGRDYADLVTMIHENNKDPLFSQVNNAPNPTLSTSTVDATALTQKGRHTLALLTDGDADRFGVLDFGGTEITANDLIVLLTYFLLNEKQMSGDIGKTVASSHMIDAIVKHLKAQGKTGASVKEMAVGYKYFVGDAVKNKTTYVLAGESSAHVGIKPFASSWDDGIAMVLSALWIVAEKKMSLSQYLEEIESQLPNRFYFNEDAISITPEQKATAQNMFDKAKEEESRNVALSKMDIAAQLRNAGVSTEIAQVNTLDGLKVVFTTGDWMLFRLSGTEFKARLYVEVTDLNRQAALRQAGYKILGAEFDAGSKINKPSDDEEFGDADADGGLTAEDLAVEIHYIMQMLGITDYQRVAQIFKTSLNPRVFIEALAQGTGKDTAAILSALDTSEFFKSVSALARLNEARDHKSISKEEYQAKKLNTTVAADRYVFNKSFTYNKDMVTEPLSDYLRLMRSLSKETPFAFRDEMYRFVGRFLGQEIVEGRRDNPDLEDIVDRITRFLSDPAVTIAQKKYIFTSGIGANEMYSHQLARALNLFFKAFGYEVQWIVVNNPAHLKNIPADATDENSIVFEMSRSGTTKETNDFFNATQHLKTRIVAANSGALYENALKLRAQGGKILLINDTRGDIGGRQMNRKTLMVFAPLFVALATGLKDNEKAKEYLRYYVDALFEANADLDYSRGLESNAVGFAEFLLRQREAGRNKFSVLYDDSLRYTTKELIQLTNEGANKNIAGGTNNNILVDYSLQQDRDMYQQIIDKEPNAQVAVVLLNKNAPDYARNKEFLKELEEQWIPYIQIDVDLDKGLDNDLKTLARTSALLQDMIVYYTYITNQDANSNPAVKFVRQITSAMFNILAEKKARGSTDITMDFKDVLAEIARDEERTFKTARESLDQKAVERTAAGAGEFSAFLRALNDLSGKLGVSSSQVADALVKSVSGEVLKTDVGEAGGSLIPLIEETFKRAEKLSGLGFASPDVRIEALSGQVVLQDNAQGKVSVAVKEGETMSLQGSLPQRLAAYMIKMYADRKGSIQYMPLTYMEADADNPLIRAMIRDITDNFAGVGITSLGLALPGVAHTGIEAVMSHPESIFNIAIVYTNAYGKNYGGLGTRSVEEGVTIDDATYVYGISNVIRMALGGSPSIIFEVKDSNDLRFVQQTLEETFRIARQTFDGGALAMPGVLQRDAKLRTIVEEMIAGNDDALAQFQNYQKLLSKEDLQEVRTYVTSNGRVGQPDKPITDGGVGGIDFRALPVVDQQAMIANVSALALAKMQLSRKVDLDREWVDFEKLIADGKALPVNRVREYLAACCQSKQAAGQAQRMATCVASMLRADEEDVTATAPEIKELLAFLSTVS